MIYCLFIDYNLPVTRLVFGRWARVEKSEYDGVHVTEDALFYYQSLLCFALWFVTIVEVFWFHIGSPAGSGTRQ